MIDPLSDLCFYTMGQSIKSSKVKVLTSVTCNTVELTVQKSKYFQNFASRYFSTLGKAFFIDSKMWHSLYKSFSIIRD